MKLRPPEVTALDDAHVAAVRAARAYDDAVELADGPCVQLLRGLARRRWQLARDLEALIEATDHHPQEPDEDRLELRALVRHARTALAGHPCTALLNEARRLEDELADALKAARARCDQASGARLAELDALLAEDRNSLVAASGELA